MSKEYTKCSNDVLERLEKIRSRHHLHLERVRIDTLFVFNDEDEQVLKHAGYPAQAVTKIIGLRERAAGLGDALIVIDRYVWSGLTSEQKDGLIDHELTHIEPVIDEQSGAPKHDTLGRMKLRIRPHDHQIGWFTEIVERHGEDAPEKRQVGALIAECFQLNLPFGYTVTAEAA